MSDQIDREIAFTMTSDAIIHDDRVGKNELLVYLAICSFVPGKVRVAFPSLATIAKTSRLSKSAVQEAIKGLEALGILTKEARKRANGSASSNLYRLTEGGIPKHGTPLKGDIPKEKEEGEAKSLASTRSREPEATPDPAPPPSFADRTQDYLRKHAPGTVLSHKTRTTVDAWGEKNGEAALKDVLDTYVHEKTRDKVRMYVNSDLPERLDDKTLDLKEPRHRQTSTKVCAYVHVYFGSECRLCALEQGYRSQGKAVPTCPKCGNTQVEEVASGAYGCMNGKCSHDYGMRAAEYFEQMVEAAAS